LFNASFKDFNSTIHGFRSQTSCFKTVCSFLISNPSDTLKLRINHERVSVRASQNSTIF
jgi:hypothetical protein